MTAAARTDAGAPGGIDLWLAFYDEMTDPDLLSNMRALLSAEERWRETAFYFPDDRKRYLVTRAMVRTVLSRYAPVAPADWEFTANRYGRPGIAARQLPHAGLGFNISHTRGLIALAVARERIVGVDVENLLVRQRSAQLAERFFAPSEVASLDGLAPQQLHERVFEYWTLKESYIKARGMGLSLPLDRFSFDLAKRQVRLSIDADQNDNPARWAFWQYCPAPGYLLALCAQRRPGALPPIALRTIIPTVSDAAFDSAVLKTSEPLTGH